VYNFDSANFCETWNNDRWMTVSSRDSRHQIKS
jgi:hypothetical protein